MFIIGDVHGCFLTLKKLITTIGKTKEIISVGDLVDKGPKTCEVLDYVMSLENFKMVIGNHEVKFIAGMEKYLKGKDVSDTMWFKNYGGIYSIKSYSHLNKDDKVRKIKKHLSYLKKQKYYFYFKKEKIFITHGFALPYFEQRLKISDKHVKTRFTCNRLEGHHFDMDKKENIDKIRKTEILNIFGHDVHEEINQRHGYMCLDTGCVYGGKLTSFNPKTNIVNFQEFIEENPFLDEERKLELTEDDRLLGRI